MLECCYLVCFVILFQMEVPHASFGSSVISMCAGIGHFAERSLFAVVGYAWYEVGESSSGSGVIRKLDRPPDVLVIHAGGSDLGGPSGQGADRRHQG